MKDFKLHNKVQLFFGKDATSNLKEIAKGHRVLLVYGGSSAKSNGSYNEITDNLKRANVPFYELSGISKAEYTHIEQEIKIVDDNNIDMVIGIGGCSCMDIAKLIAFGYYHRDTIWDYLHGKSPVNEKHLIIIEIPTYPSGGSEFGAGAVAFDSKTGDYGTMYGLRADYAILNPTYSFTLSKEILKAYFSDVYGFDGSIEDSVSKLIKIFEDFGLDMYFHSDISDEEIKKVINKDNSGGIDGDTVFKLIKSCIKNN